MTATGAGALIDDDFAGAGESVSADGAETFAHPMLGKDGFEKTLEEGCETAAMLASDVAFLVPELVSEVEGPVPVPVRLNDRVVYRFVKRIFDIVFSLCAITILLVPSIFLCIAIRIESPGNPLYSQKRVGRIGRNGEVCTFDMYKFRSMHKDADERLAELQELNEADGPLFKIKDDPRVTRIGRFIRKHSMASVIIGTPGDGESTKSLPRSANSSLDLQLCERRPGLCCIARPIITYLIFLSSAFFGGQVGVLKRSLRAVDVVSDGRVCAVAQTACAAVPLAEDWTVAA